MGRQEESGERGRERRRGKGERKETRNEEVIKKQ